ncbi:hypothetical protein KS4_17850 [Poriferisphaera corsica]|uniref:Uncharacterized protein n=1 Tax=Poriferisphaera corsica TaxID=2528020 RepID=A0A517YU56_9BACT|nr:hypothetical protein KS4_17850 [Poriferisphaera corsica]
MGLCVLPFGVATLPGDEDEVDDLSDEKEAAGEKPEDAGDPSAGVEAMDSK